MLFGVLQDLLKHEDQLFYLQLSRASASNFIRRMKMRVLSHSHLHCCYLSLWANVVKLILGTSRLHKISITAPLADDYVTVIMRRGLYRIIKMKSRQTKAARTSNKSKSHPCISKPGRFNELTARLETQREICSNHFFGKVRKDL